MRSALQGWTWALRGLGAQSTAAAGSASLQPPPPDEDEDSKSSRFIALEGILSSSCWSSQRSDPFSHGEIPFPEELRRVSLAIYLYIYVSSSSPLAASCRSVQD